MKYNRPIMTKLRDDDPPPPGYESWQPRMGRGGKFVAWVILAFILAGTALMAWQGFSRWM